MKRIILMRHAAATKSSSVSDFNSQLNGMGESQAIAAGNFIANLGIDQVLVSPTKRTTQTLSIILQQVEIPEIESVRALYESSSSKIIEIISGTADNINNLMILGHNPTIYQLVLELAQNSSKEYERMLTTTMSTAQIVVIEFTDLVDWRKISLQLGKGSITHIFNPNLELGEN
ncbi:Histidine phosphatase family protein [Candidatus Trichorickettsia mobilis]|uniref:Histidine phosphatase family protein n=1 Tax=Candidatus Trichorickettsia mobilis TaxID=1346319 RepID=A0ABZ0UTA7_9RICK|nr:histidine phosphatase family protein [Candidatus Trichorickettsia mobilis]WPY00430.1 Histidine phosphatase family protein [Candidatus Trichorickettsia mobilis]